MLGKWKWTVLSYIDLSKLLTQEKHRLVGSSRQKMLTPSLACSVNCGLMLWPFRLGPCYTQLWTCEGSQYLQAAPCYFCRLWCRSPSMDDWLHRASLPGCTFAVFCQKHMWFRSELMTSTSMTGLMLLAATQGGKATRLLYDPWIFGG